MVNFDDFANKRFAQQKTFYNNVSARPTTVDLTFMECLQLMERAERKEAEMLFKIFLSGLPRIMADNPSVFYGRFLELIPLSTVTFGKDLVCRAADFFGPHILQMENFEGLTSLSNDDDAITRMSGTGISTCMMFLKRMAMPSWIPLYEKGQSKLSVEQRKDCDDDGSRWDVHASPG